MREKHPTNTGTTRVGIHDSNVSVPVPDMCDLLLLRYYDIAIDYLLS